MINGSNKNNNKYENNNYKNNNDEFANVISPKYDYLGCYKDEPSRAIPNYLGGASTPEQCYKMSYPNYDLFGLQAGGQCFAGNINDPTTSYDKYGYQDDNKCQNNFGGPWTNQVYQVKPPTLLNDTSILFQNVNTSETWTVPEGVTQATFTVIGGSGYGINSGNENLGGSGATVIALVDLIPGDVYSIYVGGNANAKNGGLNSMGYNGSNGTGTAGEFNGGGGGGAATCVYNNDTPIIIAGGGGGCPNLTRLQTGIANTGGSGGINQNGDGGNGTYKFSFINPLVEEISNNTPYFTGPGINSNSNPVRADYLVKGFNQEDVLAISDGVYLKTVVINTRGNNLNATSYTPDTSRSIKNYRPNYINNNKTSGNYTIFYKPEKCKYTTYFAGPAINWNTPLKVSNYARGPNGEKIALMVEGGDIKYVKMYVLESSSGSPPGTARYYPDTTLDNYTPARWTTATDNTCSESNPGGYQIIKTITPSLSTTSDIDTTYSEPAGGPGGPNIEPNSISGQQLINTQNSGGAGGGSNGGKMGGKNSSGGAGGSYVNPQYSGNYSFATNDDGITSVLIDWSTPKYYYKGCYKDKTMHALPRKISNNVKVESVDECYELARFNYDVFGLQNGGECWAGNLAKDDYTKYGYSDLAKCDILGNRLTNQVYEIYKAPTTTKANEFATSENYKYKGCYTDKLDDPALPQYYDTPAKSVDDCYNMMKDDNKYDIFALQYGGECWAGNKTKDSYQKYGKVDGNCDNILGNLKKNQVYEIIRKPTTTKTPTTTKPQRTRRAPATTVPLITISETEILPEIAANLIDSQQILNNIKKL